MNAFPKIWSISSPEVRDSLLLGGVEVTEKIDGSACGFGLDETSKLLFRSKGSIIYHDGYVRQPDKLFKAAVEYVISIKDKLHPETAYYGEVLSSPHHNTLTYGSTPRNNIVIYGICSKGHWVDDHEILTKEADTLGFDSVPLIYSGVITHKGQLDNMMKQVSRYGNTTIEGVVIKNYNQLAVSAYSSACFGKLVSDQFKEANSATWNAKTSKVEDFYANFTNKARWEKSIQHLRDDGKLTDTSKDIGLVITSVLEDFETEQKETVKEQLYNVYIRTIKQFVTKGLPEYYKAELAKKTVFSGEQTAEITVPSVDINESSLVA
jgi:hypothetical protein